jgi:hypothetical protein
MLIFSGDSIACSGGALDVQCGGRTVRVYAKGTLTSLAVSIGADVDHLSGIVSTVFDSLSGNAQLLIPNADLVRLNPTGSGTYDLRISASDDWD